MSRFNKAKSNNCRKIVDLQSGFTLVESIVALLILLIVMLGVVTTMIYAINYNAANRTRAEAITVAQKEIEFLRSAKFSKTIIDSNLIGGVKSSEFVKMDSGENFRVDISVDDDPFAAGIQVNNNNTLKEVTVTVTALNESVARQTIAPVEIVLRRVRSY